EGSAFARVMRPQGVALPILGLALRLRLHNDGETIMAARLALGPVAPVPFRARQTEAFLVGRRADEQTLSEGVAVLSREVNPRTSPHRATADYRREVLPVLFKTAWQAAVTRARVS
ncbi:MAG: xanthine dehydrogenase family protein subunit M, partial [Chloroflexi bacterium]|nr:xanthine dehydrogenase family protein subunit M [Chloroflexota bacterium]